MKTIFGKHAEETRRFFYNCLSNLADDLEMKTKTPEEVAFVLRKLANMLFVMDKLDD